MRGQSFDPGRPLVATAAAAIAALGAARIQEFERATPRPPASSRFDMMRVLEGMARGNPVQRVKAIVALQEFMRAWDVGVRRTPGMVARINEMVTKGDFPAGAFLADYLDRFLVVPGEIDDGWRMLFDTHDIAELTMMPNKSGFKVLNVRSGLIFRKRGPGERVELSEIRGDDVFVPYDMYGGAVGIERVWWDDADYISINDMLTIFRAAYYDERSRNFYSLITSLDNGINFNTGADLTAKINNAAAEILRSVKDKGYMAGPSSVLYIVHAPESSAAVNAVLETQRDLAVSSGRGKEKLAYRMVAINTMYVPGAGAGAGPYVVLPGRMLKAGLRMDLTLFGDFDIYSYAEALAGYGRYAGIVGDTDQIKRIT